MTPLGLIFLGLFLTVLIVRPASFIWCVIAAMPFPDSAMLVIGGIGVSPYFGSLIVVAFLALGDRLHSSRKLSSSWTPVGCLAVCFLTYTLLLTMVAPSWFKGLPINSPRMGGNNELGALFTPLTYSDSNAAQLIYLALNLVLVLYISRLPNLGSPRDYLLVGFLAAVTIAIVVTALENVGLYSIHSFFDNSPRNFYGAELTELRFRGQFSEPSHLGAVATAGAVFALSILREKGGRRGLAWIVLLGSSICLAGSATGTALIAIAVLAITQIASGIVQVFTGGRIRILVFVSLPFLACLLLAAGPTVLASLAETIAAKQQSISFAIRAPQDENSWSLFWRTDALGVGLGSNRSSSLASLLLSNVGAVGCGLLIVILGMLVIRNARSPQMRPVLWALIGFCVSAVVALADFTSPVLWVSVGLCFAYYRGNATHAEPKRPSEGAGPRRIHGVLRSRRSSLDVPIFGRTGASGRHNPDTPRAVITSNADGIGPT